jgi:protein-L-isoaspartate(D-aspartate) O-methyltransferase
MTALEPARRFFGDVVASLAKASDPRIADAFAEVACEDFLGPGPWLALAGDGYIRTPNADPALLYQNLVFALVPDKRLNNGEPSLHARCMSAIAPRAGESVLQVGAAAATTRRSSPSWWARPGASRRGKSSRS